jgi:hypothetical protein
VAVVDANGVVIGVRKEIAAANAAAAAASLLRPADIKADMYAEAEEDEDADGEDGDGDGEGEGEGEGEYDNLSAGKQAAAAEAAVRAALNVAALTPARLVIHHDGVSSPTFAAAAAAAARARGVALVDVVDIAREPAVAVGRVLSWSKSRGGVV